MYGHTSRKEARVALALFRPSNFVRAGGGEGRLLPGLMIRNPEEIPRDLSTLRQLFPLNVHGEIPGGNKQGNNAWYYEM